MSWLGQKLNGAQWLGSKIAQGASWLGHKTAGVLSRVAPIASVFSPVIGGALAKGATIAEGIGRVGDIARNAIGRGNQFDMEGIKHQFGSIRSAAGDIKSAYQDARGQLRNTLERPR
jgi:hypothetical protein